ncbi:MAG: Asp-tRNA(Asn)/Glu-tRNA(Gln) amidotransferase subunit GatA [Phycisphaeraceae bacterium]|nr:Asp-tRNA(Asn)/Glu-tRNA(Gln) amidotransferase subunit GatA [Phycisphaeraceae bacterium]
MNLTELDLCGLKEAIDAGRCSALEATTAYLERIEALNPAINAYHEVYAQRALDQARLADEGHRPGPLSGLPISIKDNLCTEYGRTTCSSRMLAEFEAPYTATVVKRLEAAGAVILGKTNMDEFAMGSSSEHCAWGPVRNPWDTERGPGGSAGGAAAAAAAWLCAGGLGSDTGGSIRQPAAYCGVVGLKPTYGRVSRYGLVAFASSLDQIGPVTRSVRDSALLMNVISGHDPLDSTSSSHPVDDFLAGLEEPPARLRIGLARQYLGEGNHAAVKAAVDQAVKILSGAGAQIIEVDLPHTEYGIPTYYIVATSEASSNLARYDGVHYGHRTRNAKDLVDLYAASRAEGFGDEVKRRIMLGTYALSSGYFDAYYVRALKVRRLIRRDFDQAFENCDVLLCPTTTDPAFVAGKNADDPLSMYLNDVYTVNANLAGIPGISIPGGLAEVDGVALPVGVQLLGPMFEEARLLRIARLLEREIGLGLCPPVVSRV